MTAVLIILVSIVCLAGTVVLTTTSSFLKVVSLVILILCVIATAAEFQYSYISLVAQCQAGPVVNQVLVEVLKETLSQ